MSPRPAGCRAPRESESGFTIIELLIASTLMLLVTGAILTSFETFDRNAEANQTQVDAQQSARQGIDVLARELRNLASPGLTGAPIETATDRQVVFRTVDRVGPNTGANVANIRRVRYCVQELGGQRGRLWKQWQLWTTATPPLVPPVATCPGPTSTLINTPTWNGQAMLSDYLFARNNNPLDPVFTYDSAALENITFVGADLRLKTRRNGSVETRVQSSVALRNQNRTPTASFQATTEGRTVVLNGSSSVDPDDAQLRYEWYIAGSATPLADTGPNVQYTPPGAGTFSVRLKVVDPGGLFSEVTQTVSVS